MIQSFIRYHWFQNHFHFKIDITLKSWLYLIRYQSSSLLVKWTPWWLIYWFPRKCGDQRQTILWNTQFKVWILFNDYWIVLTSIYSFNKELQNFVQLWTTSKLPDKFWQQMLFIAEFKVSTIEIINITWPRANLNPKSFNHLHNYSAIFLTIWPVFGPQINKFISQKLLIMICFQNLSGQ